MGTPATVKAPRPAHRLTAEEARQPITGVTCGKCGRTDAVIYPVESGSDTAHPGALICPSCSPGWLVSWLAFSIQHQGVPA